MEFRCLRAFYFVVFLAAVTHLGSAHADPQLKRDAKQTFDGAKNFAKHLFQKTTRKVKKTVDKIDRAAREKSK